MQEQVDALLKELKETFPHLQIRCDPPTGTVGGIYFIDFIHQQQFCWCVEVFPDFEEKRYSYGISIIDDETAYGMGADLVCGHAPTLIKYLKMLLPKAEPCGT